MTTKRYIITAETWPYIRDALRFGPPVLIADECHRLKRRPREATTETHTEEESQKHD